ncbi:MAG: hypothetical protein A3D31_10060 [Candidatus Fluviicola riflensis]|nr:MAG: hypothetical protein CHH17_14475 [Candidatus Fluviicola riflensis]OGS77348.1 MAG: hypothetical protein A3D31_10060 [Candidatus Fluviicola riflensis]OGS83928.1 MAG: hypothetical protein A3E30_11460 [Fluviicola sp. RIFCSPHIGHO2_12_FULL_43_24]OGS84415.1 MAG: hypothetical protein A2724_07000 [Fluviicola sp. RIFCSPHIGHO2_01_FULL_43_53]
MEDNHEFMAYTLKKYCEFEKITESDLLNVLDCSLSSYYELALCKAPDISEPDFMSRIKVISEYVNIDTSKLTKMIKHVNTVLKFTTGTGTILMAARDKEEGKDDKK